MTISDLGSIGEMIAAIATVATLAYLAVQIRHLSNATKAEAARGTVDLDAAVLALAQDEEYSKLFVTGLMDYSALNPYERARFAWAMGSLLGPAARSYEHVSLGIFSEEHFINHSRGQLIQLETPGGADFWLRHGHTFPPEFIDFVSRNFDLKPNIDEGKSNQIT